MTGMTEKDRKPPKWRHTETLFWGLSSLMSGIALGILIGVFVSVSRDDISINSYQDAKEVSSKIGWPIFEEIVSNSSDLMKMQLLSKIGLRLEEVLQHRFAFLKDPTGTDQMIMQSKNLRDVRPQATKFPELINKYHEGSGQVNINSATVAQIDAVPMMSTRNAEMIYKFIKEKNGIKTFSELLDIKGVGEKTVEKLKLSFHIK